MLLLRGVVQHYDWGARRFIPTFLGVPDDGQPWAELWFGTHPSGPADALVDDSWTPLRDAVGDLDVLVKILSAERPLSLQTHPSRETARDGFARENSAGVALTDATRTYKDTSDKPEMLIALTDFSALCGFAPVTSSVALLQSMGWNHEASLLEKSGVHAYMTWAYQQSDVPDVSRAPQWLADIATMYPRDRSLRVAPLLNVVHLLPGEALALPAGNLHAYLQGSAVEVMSSSDNVIRAGFTSKHVDVDELLRVVDTSELSDPKVSTTPIASGVHYDCSIDAFSVDALRVAGEVMLRESPRHRILVCTDGNVGALHKGEAALLQSGEEISLTGTGTVYVCSGR